MQQTSGTGTTRKCLMQLRAYATTVHGVKGDIIIVSLPPSKDSLIFDISLDVKLGPELGPFRECPTLILDGGALTFTECRSIIQCVLVASIDSLILLIL